MKRFFWVFVFLVVLCTGCASLRSSKTTTAGPTPPDVIIDHDAGTISPGGLIRKRPGENVHIEIQHTSRQCFSFNVAVAPTPAAQPAAATTPTIPLDETVPFDVHYDGDPLTITIAAYPIDPGSDKRCKALPDRKPGTNPGPWVINVGTDGWDLAFAGAFTADHLTNPTYSLEQSPTTASTYKIVKSESDSVRLGSAAMVHLYHTEPDPLGAAGVNLAPFSFGLGVGDNSAVRYFLGTGVRFNKKLFLTVGAVLGSKKTLPNGKHVGDTVTDANFLNNSGSRTAGKLFFSVSYSFIGVGPDAFKGSFTAPANPVPSSPPASTGGTGAATSIEVTSAPHAQGEAFTYKLTVVNKGTEFKDATLEQPLTDGITGKWTASPSGGAKCGGDQTASQTKLSAKISLPKDDKCVFTVTLTGSADHPILPVFNPKVTITGSDGKELYGKAVEIKTQ